MILKNLCYEFIFGVVFLFVSVLFWVVDGYFDVFSGRDGSVFFID